MPELVMEKIIAFSDFKAVLTLRQVCRDYWNFIDDLNDSKLPDSKFKKIGIVSSKEEQKITLDFVDSARSRNYFKYSEMGRFRSFNGKRTDLKKSNFADVAIRDLELILKFQKSDLECLGFWFNEFQLQADSSTFTLPIKLSNTFSVSGRKIKTKTLSIKTGSQANIMSVLPFIDSETLEVFDLFPKNGVMKIEIEIDDIVKTEQWKKAKIFSCGFHLLHLNVEDICHFSSCSLKVNSISARDLDTLKKAYLSSSKFIFSHIVYHDITEEEEISNLWGPAYVFEWTNEWYFRMKDSEEKIMRISIINVYEIQFCIVEMRLVPRRAIVHNYSQN
ncbi:unnamed protein product [Caenorhabditis nigoni]